MAILGVLIARSKGWPHKAAWFKLGSWGLVLNVLALIYGGIMLVNFALWNNPAFGDFGNALRANTNPTIRSSTKKTFCETPHQAQFPAGWLPCTRFPVGSIRIAWEAMTSAASA